MLSLSVGMHQLLLCSYQADVNAHFFLILANSTYVFPLLCHKIPGIKQGVGVKKDLVSLSKAIKEDQVKTVGPGSSVI